MTSSCHSISLGDYVFPVLVMDLYRLELLLCRQTRCLPCVSLSPNGVSFPYMRFSQNCSFTRQLNGSSPVNNLSDAQQHYPSAQ